MADHIMILRDALRNYTALTWSDAIFVDKSRPLGLETGCLIHDPDDINDEEADLPAAAMALGYDYLIDVQTFQSICLNLLEQTQDADAEELLGGLQFYLKNDAFIVLG